MKKIIISLMITAAALYNQLIHANEALSDQASAAGNVFNNEPTISLLTEFSIYAFISGIYAVYWWKHRL